MRRFHSILVSVGLLVSGVAALGTSRASQAQPPDFTYATMSDDTPIALAVSYPSGFSTTDDHRWPVLFMMDGYEGGAGALDPAEWGNKFVMVHASIRGTGCSGGRFDLFDRRSAEDGKEIIDGWIQDQPWADGKVGIIGHSYPGLTGFLVATTDPKHLAAIAVSGLIDDMYRGITYIGGVPDPGFPLLWTGVARPASEQSGNFERYTSDTSCPQALARRQAPDALDDPILNGVADREDGAWWSAHSLVTYIRGITKPIHITQQYQDEQTGPRGGVLLWQQRPAGVPKRLVLTNGVHATHMISRPDEVAWVDCYIILDGKDCPGDIADPSRRVRIHFETTASNTNPPLVAADYPIPGTRWQRDFLRADGKLTQTGPATGEQGRSYVATTVDRHAYLSGAGVADSASSDEAGVLVDQAYSQGYGPVVSSSGPDELTYTRSFDAPTALAGPAMADFWVTSTAPDTDVFVQLIDADSSGNLQYLQRGLLRASLLAVDPLRADRIADGDLKGEIYRPWHPFTNPSLLVPGQTYEMQIEIFPVGHVFRTGHRLIVKISSPPAADELYMYGSAQPPALNTILSDEAHPSSLLLPLLDELPPVAQDPPPCGDQIGVRCAEPALP